MSDYIKGFFRDQLTDGHGGVVHRTPWRHNKVVANCSRLNAALMKGDKSMQGILFWAVGAGFKRWDRKLPQPSADAVKLTREVLRRPIQQEDIVYIDDKGQPSQSPTQQVEVTTVFKSSDFTSSQPGRRVLREFGLFGGNASKKVDSGLMIDYVIHPRINMQEELTLTRKLRLSFRSEFTLEPEPLGFGAKLDIIHIDGIGEVFAKILLNNDISIIGDLLDVPHWKPIGSIPHIKLVEFCAKARMVTGLAIDLAPFGAIAGLNITTVTGTNPKKLLEMTRSSILTLKDVIHMQQRLAVLQVALDDRLLQNIRIKDLV
jgi:hypothetical protein